MQLQHLDVTDDRDVDRGRRDEREQPGRLGERLGRLLERGLELVAHRREIERERCRAPLDRVDELLRVEVVAALGRHASRRRVRMRQQPEALELGQLAADGRGREIEAAPVDERLRAHGLTARHVLLDDEPQDLALSRCELHLTSDGSPGHGGVCPARGSRGARQKAASSSAVTASPSSLPRRVRRIAVAALEVLDEPVRRPAARARHGRPRRRRAPAAAARRAGAPSISSSRRFVASSSSSISCGAPRPAASDAT